MNNNFTQIQGQYKVRNHRPITFTTLDTKLFHRVQNIPPLIVLCFIPLYKICSLYVDFLVSYKLKLCSNHVCSKFIRTIFQKHMLTLYLYHMFNILTPFQTFHWYYIGSSDLYSVILILLS